jgi:hypothetical protein
MRPRPQRTKNFDICAIFRRYRAMVVAGSMGITLTLAIGECKAQTAKIVGTGAVSCAMFLSDIARNPIYEREYFSWAQGYMSGILMRAPSGRDDNLDLMPPDFPVKAQLQFFREFCAEHQQDGFADAAVRLYERLREFVRK